MKDERLTSICFLCWFACGWIGKPTKERLSFIIAGPEINFKTMPSDKMGSNFDGELSLTNWGTQGVPPLCFTIAGGFKYCFIFTPKIGEDVHFDSYFSGGLVQPPTR